MSEAYADGLAGEGERRTAWEAAWEVEGWADIAEASDAEVDAAAGALAAGDGPGSVRWTGHVAAARSVAGNCSRALAELAGHRIGEPGLNEAQAGERAAQAHLLRHLVGNPWLPLVSPAHWPATIIKLAEAQYEGEDCSMALHDALLEEGKNDFAPHFREGFHPKGCAWLDVILGKE